jgi:hypothetical protein
MAVAFAELRRFEEALAHARRALAATAAEDPAAARRRSCLAAIERGEPCRTATEEW